jgi:iron complex outermembrane receptor protein
MKSKILYSSILMVSGSLLGQGTNNNAGPSTLNEISIQGTSIPKLDLFKSSILTKDQIRDRQIDNLVDLSGMTPNLHINANAIQSYGDIMTIRGIANTQLFGAPGVQLYVDGVPQADVSSYESTLYDVESIEVLRGPQGYKFGKSVTGGAINIQTETPGNERSSELSTSFASYNAQKYNLSSNGPISDSFSYSIGVQRALSDGFLNNVSGSDNTSKTWHGALKFFMDQGNGTRISFGSNFETHELGAQPIVNRNQSDFYYRATDFEEYTEIDRNQQFLTVESDMDSFRFVSISNRNDWSMNPNRLDLDISTESNMTSPAQTSVIIQDHNEWTQEFRIESQEDSELEWNLGVFYADSEIKGDATRSFGFTEVTRYTIESENMSVFSSIGKAFSDQNYLSLGLRYDNFEKKMQRTKNYTNFTTFAPETKSFSRSHDFSSLSPSFQWEHTFADGFTGNARMTYAEKPGGFSPYTNTETQSTFSEEETMAYELSFLFNPSDSWGVNLTGYLNNIEDYQFELPDANDPTSYYVANADEVIAKGIEIEGFIKPSELVTFSIAYGICDSKYKKFTGSGLEGKKVSFVPDHTLAFSMNYRFKSGIYGQIGTKTIGETFYWNYSGDNPNDKIASYTLLDANLGYDFNYFKINLFGLNLTQEEYYTSLVNNLPGSPGIAGSPRVVGMSLSFEF